MSKASLLYHRGGLNKNISSPFFTLPPKSAKNCCQNFAFCIDAPLIFGDRLYSGSRWPDGWIAAQADDFKTNWILITQVVFSINCSAKLDL